MVGIGIRMLRIPFEWLELAFECFESRSNGWNWHSNASNPVRMVGIGIRIPFKWLVLAFERMPQMSFEWLKLCFKYIESRSNGWNWHSNASNPFEWLELAFESRWKSWN